MIVIGGIGGSGTRVPALILQKIGFQQGYTNYASDSLHLRYFYKRWVNKKITPIMLAHLKVSIARQKRTASPGTFFIKNPNAIHFLEAFDTVSACTFIHIIRNGRYLAGKYHKLDHLGQNGRDFLEFWGKTNQKAYFYGQKMEKRYFLLKYEDLCFGKGLNRFLAFLDLEKHENLVKNLIVPSNGKNKAVFHPSLKFFGY